MFLVFFFGYTKLSFFLHERRLEDLEDEKEGCNKMISHTTGESKVSFSLYMVGEDLELVQEK